MDDDTFANIERLTAQVETLKRERDVASEVAYERSLRIDEMEHHADELRQQVQRLQEALTACEQERDAARKHHTASYQDYQQQLARVRVLETALRQIVATCEKFLWVGAKTAQGHVYDTAKDALNPAPPAAKEHCPRRLMGEDLPLHMPCDTGDHSKDAPPAETPAPTCGDAEPQAGGSFNAYVARDASVDAPAGGDYWEGYADGAKTLREDNIRLRAELAAANEEIAPLKANVSGWVDRYQALQEAHAATTAKLGRAVAALRVARDRPAVYERHSTDPQRRVQLHGVDAADIDAILADADGTQAAEAWRAQLAVIDLARKHPCPEGDGGGGCVMCAAIEDMDEKLAAVDARRGVSDIDWDGREAYARKECAECGSPGTRHFSTEGDGSYWLCEAADEAHGDDRYGGWPSTAPEICGCERNGCGTCAEMGCRYCENCAMPTGGSAL
jgi:hypothetical protein